MTTQLPNRVPVVLRSSWLRVVCLLTLAISLGFLVRGVTITGSWEIECEMDLNHKTIELAFEVASSFTTGSLRFTNAVAVSQNGIEKLEVDTALPVGGLNLAVEIAFEGASPEFDDAQLSVSGDVGGVDWDAVLSITGIASSTALTLVGRGDLSFAQWDLELKFTDCASQFDEFSFELSNLNICCVSGLSFEINFDTGGFDEALVAFKRLPIPFYEFISLSGSIGYILSEKTFVTRLTGSPSKGDSCLGIGLKVTTDDAGILGFEVDSMDIRCDIGKVQFAFVSTSAWDGITLSDGSPGECGVKWQVQLYMKESSSSLFNLDSITAKLTYALFPALKVEIATDMSMHGDAEILVAFGGSW